MLSTDGVANNLESGLLFKNGKMSLRQEVAGSECLGVTMDRPFDVRNYPTQTPTFYFSGDLDPATPPWQADYHYANNLYADRTLVRILGGGHGPLYLNEGPACSKAVFAAIGEQPTALSTVLKSPVCYFPFRIQTQTAIQRSK